MIISKKTLKLNGNEITAHLVDRLKQYATVIRINGGKMSNNYYCYTMYSDGNVTHSGFSDLLILCKNGVSVFCEVKGEGDVVRPSQNIFSSMLNKNGHIYVLVTNANMTTFIAMILTIQGVSNAK